MRSGYEKLKSEYVSVVELNLSEDSIESFVDSKIRDVENESILNWDIKYHGGYTYLQKGGAIFGFVFMYMVGSVYKDGWSNLIPSLDKEYFLSLIPALLISYVGWTVFSSLIYCYRFGNHSMAIIMYKDEPEVHYVIARWFGWFGTILCLLLGFYFGPEIFVGAGGMALFSLMMMNYKKSCYSKVIPYDAILGVTINKTRKELAVIFLNQDYGVKDGKLTVFEKLSYKLIYVRNNDFENVCQFLSLKVDSSIHIEEDDNWCEDKYREIVSHKYKKLGKTILIMI
ncbi:hypothetical protein JCM19237_1094 [Photobacterium aphoticum]|uniref:Uncharacterized protein n=1 Tax=Photobacterium aphoticum TaxID=754436 RepID=A0A090R9Z8_9GAMM|nr:hypothetical protein JCM19237_1094 [Photobacterium aphoticum]